MQCEVDKGRLSTNVTRLERMIRDASGFLAIYPLDDDGVQDVSNAELVERSRYFRLELELAARSRRPGLVLVDRRFRGVIDIPTTMCREQFDVREISGSGAKPSSGRFERVFLEFCERVRAASSYDLSAGCPGQDSETVGLLVPPDTDLGYHPEHIQAITQAIRQARYKPVLLSWPPSITAGWVSDLRNFNWVLVDVGPESMSTGIIGFLHGAFIPTMRLMRVAGPDQAEPRIWPDSSLYGGVEVGYWKAIARWFDLPSLTTGLQRRLTTLDAPTRRLGTLDDALAYFQEAAKRKERVFISYSGADEEATRDLRAAFVARFQDVFDYRDGKSIRPGQPWIEEISTSLSKSPICVPLLSPSYIDSGNCKHELDDAIALRDNKQTSLFPVKLNAAETFSIPPTLASTQYLRLSDFKNPEGLVDAIIAQLPA